MTLRQWMWQTIQRLHALTSYGKRECEAELRARRIAMRLEQIRVSTVQAGRR